MRGGRQFAVLILLLFGLVSVDAGSATAAVLTVTDCGDTTPGGAPGQLRRLINDANPGDTILVPGCIITLSGTTNEDANAGGDLDIGKNLIIQGAGARATVIDGASRDRVFDVVTPQGPVPPLDVPPVLPINVTISDMMIRHGSGDSRGGGIRNGGTLTLNRVIVRNNVVGGAIEAAGGGIANHGTMELIDSAVEQNVTSGPVLHSGAGIINGGTLTLTRSTVSRNVSLRPAEFFSNTGSIANYGVLAIVDSTVSGNNGGEDGPGGIFNVATLSVTGSTIVSNFSALGLVDGIHSTDRDTDPDTPPATATVTNTIVANNFNTESAFPSSQCAGVTSSGGNLATDSSCGPPGPGDAVAANVGLGGLSDQGGPTQTHPLLPGSPAIDTALPGPCNPTDQRGMPRFPAVCDKGSFEFTPPIFADMPADHFARGAAEALYASGVTSGCGTAPLVFCPDDFLTRAQISVFLLRALEAPGYIPPPAVGIFADVPIGDPFAPWIEELFNRGITSGCGLAPLRFCPNDPVTRGQLAVLLLRTLSIVGFVPPPAIGIFADVPVGDPFAPWVEEFFRRGMTSGCQLSPLAYCPAEPATRAQTALFLVRAFGFGF
jgi:hypothetical protein